MQHRILDEAEQGKRHKEMAAALRISPNTIKTYARIILLKTGAQSLVEAAWLRRQSIEREAT